jgi:hypothetical protein
VAEHAEEQEREEPRSVAELTTEIVVAYVARDTLAVPDLGDLLLGGDTSALRVASSRPGARRAPAAIGRIRELRGAGLSLRAIARRVHADLGITVSAMTARRVLAGPAGGAGGTSVA